MLPINLRRTLLMLAVLTVFVASISAQHQDVKRPQSWNDLVYGGRFMDRFEPMPLLSQRTAYTWGVDEVKPRDVLNGIEEPAWS